MAKNSGGVTVTTTSAGDWKIILAGGGMVALGIGAALLAAQLGTAALILAIGGSVGLAAAGIGKGLQYWQRGKGEAYLGQAFIMAARRGELGETVDKAHLLTAGQRERPWQ